jgi:hypothetical protein
MDFPDNCLRGVRKQEFITPEGGVSSAVFHPDFRTSESRADGGAELSINWEDNETVLEFTINLKSNGYYQFAYGAVRLPRQEIDHINRFPSSMDGLSYERAPLPDNPYHGNIVFRQDLSKPTVKMVAAALALASSKLLQRA